LEKGPLGIVEQSVGRGEGSLGIVGQSVGREEGSLGIVGQSVGREEGSLGIVGQSVGRDLPVVLLHAGHDVILVVYTVIALLVLAPVL